MPQALKKLKHFKKSFTGMRERASQCKTITITRLDKNTGNEKGKTT